MFQTELIEKCKKNDQSAQMQLYRQYCDGMYCVAMRFVKDSMEAEDIVQESFLKAFSKIYQFTAEVTFGAWLKRIVINKAIDQLKKNKAYLIQLEEVHLKVVDDEAQDKWLVEDTITLEEIKHAIETLPDKYKYVVMLYLVEGYDHQEISEILSISEIASRTQLSRGKKKLQGKLKKIKDGTRY
ncbi:RNA polymerase sigma-70 factor, ECF subfamily [Flavobacteriaceae bacterium MAR_2010_188]|nr:RNA polymerase sigma-70 factor, ECF subfamily [Flavobacteriaceae bacterium MAR_2010_188]